MTNTTALWEEKAMELVNLGSDELIRKMMELEYHSFLNDFKFQLLKSHALHSGIYTAICEVENRCNELLVNSITAYLYAENLDEISKALIAYGKSYEATIEALAEVHIANGEVLE